MSEEGVNNCLNKNKCLNISLLTYSNSNSYRFKVVFPIREFTSNTFERMEVKSSIYLSMGHLNKMVLFHNIKITIVQGQ